MSSDTDKQDLSPDPGDSDEIEILEVLGLEEDSPAAPVRRERPSRHQREEVTLEFDEGGGGADEPARPPQADPAEREQLARLRADFENFKRRTEREREAAERQAAAGLITRLLPVLDNFERALSSEVPDGDGRAFQQGVALIFRQLLEELRREGLSAVDSLAQQFDPTVHEAVDTQRVPGLPGNTVVEELRRGYLLHDRLLRPAQVRVCVSDDETAAGSDRTGEET